MAEYGRRWFPDTKEEGPGFRDRAEKSWRMPLRLMAGKRGYVSFAPRPMCGPSGDAGDVSLTSQPVCRESTRRLSLRRTKDGIQDYLPRAVGKRGSQAIKKKSSRSCMHKWSCSVSSKEGRGQARRCRESRRGEEKVLKRTEKKKVEEESDCKKKLDEQKKSVQRQLGDKSLRIWIRFSATGRKKNGRKSCERSRGRGRNFCRSTRGRRRGLRSCRVCRTRRGTTSRTLALGKEMEERTALFEARFQALSEKSGDCRRAAAELDDEIQSL